MLNNQITKIIQIPFLDKVSFCFINQTKILLLKTNFNTIKYFLIPSGVNCVTKKNVLTLTINSSEKKDIVKLDQFYNIILWLKKITKN